MPMEATWRSLPRGWWRLFAASLVYTAVSASCYVEYNWRWKFSIKFGNGPLRVAYYSSSDDFYTYVGDPSEGWFLRWTAPRFSGVFLPFGLPLNNGGFVSIPAWNAPAAVAAYAIRVRSARRSRRMRGECWSCRYSLSGVYVRHHEPPRQLRCPECGCLLD